ncbi:MULTISPECIES: nucleotide exchange factor GrpE [Pseudothermotoga]|jgi:molecular chaperone GrpE|uniref:Protein GrpE n=1 Tax=Pseudothermotoga lettingae (strain ATCC BAA-301 / DSM 14385 / NBRC 107922 / TMO) TaxID=416591 RepID=GRPE_PSELT|nr:MULTISPECIES: nucleotide exchange factor GrpE [Pseudothermotoga]A8F851.1 RecName: Full=Protein GrpE; AltName: Full=HSP-70 cofactor [Pseudothermotoga lettingae TMO]ABV34335.1 GrpE protein [Pseudothermotoga lettingae TMO]KUK21198.1 MAG: Protein GrpE [Pseudothermotoga lettingae]MDI3494917.1 molecular chaperone GrpE [Pseudothermotoga sp.]MDK2885036.1 molecular chaperone GrpE [Pseudothermotoga sp.]GLI48720.1 protein GrpE [Pseudothermotoga lettingae TMO]
MNENEKPQITEQKENQSALDQLIKEKHELLEHLRQLKAQFENYKRDSLREKEQVLKNANEYFLVKLIPVLDDMERAFEEVRRSKSYKNFYSGMEIIYKKLWKILNDEGLFKIEPKEKFDPFEHEAVERVETDEKEEYSILKILENGYKFHKKIVKPVKVQVAVRPRGENGAKTE